MSLRDSLQSIIDDFRIMQKLQVKEAAGGTPKYDERGNPGRRGAKKLYDRSYGKPKDFGSTVADLERTVGAIAQLVRARRREMEHTDWVHESFGNIPEDLTDRLRHREALRAVGSSPVEVAFTYGYTSDKSVRELRKRNGLDPMDGTRIKDKPLTRKYT